MIDLPTYFRTEAARYALQEDAERRRNSHETRRFFDRRAAALKGREQGRGRA